MRLYLVRHGESEGNRQLLLYGRTDCPLTEAGRADALAAAEKLRGLEIRRCYASPLSRAADTARACADALGLPVLFRDDLMEQDMGDLENTSFTEMSQKYPQLIRYIFDDWTSSVPPGGECYADLRTRTLRALGRLPPATGTRSSSPTTDRCPSSSAACWVRKAAAWASSGSCTAVTAALS